ncbi:MAG: site-2 protease family protein [Gammaproteobacteria bacterium]|nr:site-2 protease family protein [Gammaproteobacteria bacterium]MCI0591152.1 site-2 protease family protein [Gammaproteobacteria bacterium]
MNELSLVQKILVWAPPVLFAITFHEVAHGWMARRLGDPTAEMLGRLTLNPIKHVDPLGTVLVPILLLVAGGFIFGWAKPVPVTWENLKHPKRDMAFVALAGPVANLLMIIFWAVLVKLAVVLTGPLDWVAQPLAYMGWAGVVINSILMILNLFPLPPLDGSRVLSAMLPGPMAWQLSRIEPYGLIILLILLVTGLLGKMLWPLVLGLQQLVYRLVGL